MRAETRTLREVLHGDRRFEVPVYQRPYVWELEKQWEPLWQDIEATAIRLAEVRADAYAKHVEAPYADQGAAPHFLGAIVIEDRPVMTGDVDTRLVVDGQQRLTTLQLLFRGVLDAFQGHSIDPKLSARLHKGVMNDESTVSEVDLLKVAPRPAERSDFAEAMAASAPDPAASRFAAARDYFARMADAYLVDTDVPEDPYADSSSVEARASLLSATLLGLVKLVVIDLEDVDDAQVIFEALNARNTPLSATDLVKNLLFLRAQAHHHDPQQLYDTLWKRFDDDSDWWLTQVGTGHAQRARQDWLLGDWLIAQLGRTINVGRLYGEFRQWLDVSGTKPFDALQTLNRFADAYEALNGRRAGASTREGEAFSRIERLGITAAMPLLLWLFVQPADLLSAKDRERAVLAVESYVIRRMAARYQTRAYGQAFVEVLKAGRTASGDLADEVINALRAAPHSYGWPTLDELREAFGSGRYYGPGGINQDRLRLLLGAVDRKLQVEALKSEGVTVDYASLQIEHIIPQGWRSQWPVQADSRDDLAIAEHRREQHVNRIGNLTLVNDRLNPALGNHPWAAKRAELAKHSHLQLNAGLVELESWDEGAIVERGTWLADQIDAVWPGPEAPRWQAHP